MTPNNTDEQIRHVFDEWHRAVKDQDAEGMAALYAHDGVLETPAVLALWPEREDAVVHGRDAIAQFFAQSFQARSGEGVFEDWFRSGRYFSDGRLLIWEYPRETPKGDQTDIVRVHGSRERADHPPPRLLGMGGVQQAPQCHQQGPPVGSAVPPHRAGHLPSPTSATRPVGDGRDALRRGLSS